MHTFFAHFLTFLLLLTSLFLIVLVLIQRGKGGGLAGAFGGMGGQSAFGTKAGDLFTKITIGVAAVWIILCLVMVKVLGVGGSALSEQMGSDAEKKPAATAPVSTDKQSPAGKGETPAAPRQNADHGKMTNNETSPSFVIQPFRSIALLQSMTGFGESHSEQDGLAVTVEIRAINNRYFKLSVRTTEGYAALEPLVEGEVRGAIHRGTIQVNLRIDRKRSPEDYRINVDVLERYQQQLLALMRKWNPKDAKSDPSLEALLPLPGVVNDAPGEAADATADWPIVRRTVQAGAGEPGPDALRRGTRHGRRPDGQLPGRGRQSRSGRAPGADGGRGLPEPAFRPAQEDVS